jgi:hypothetical protein
MKHLIATAAAVGALVLVAAIAAGTASAKTAHSSDDAVIGYLTCSDGTTYTVDTSLFDLNDLGQTLCPDGFTTSTSDPGADPGNPGDSAGDGSSGGDGSSTDSGSSGGGGEDLLSVAVPTGGQDVGLGAASNQTPDTDSYSTQVQCPDGSIWAVAAGQDFTCPTS